MTVLFDSFDITLADANLSYQPNWLAPDQAQQWLEALLQSTEWGQPVLSIYGREYLTPRLSAWYGEPQARYRFSGLVNQPQPWTPLLKHIRDRLAAELNQPFNAALLNYYRSGEDSMGWHSDDEPELGAEPVIASLSLGGVRRFDLRRVGSSRIEHSLPLESGSLLVMAGATQHYWQHQVAKTRRACAPRLNLTFRTIRFSQ